MPATTPDGPGVPRLMSVPALVGREPELAAFEQALTGAPAIVLVEGEAGIGKSRLLREFLGSPIARRRRSLVAWCPPFREPYTLGPIVDAVRQAADRVAGLRLSPLAGALRPLFPEWADELPVAPDPLDDVRAARHRLFRALAEVLQRLKVSVLAVEDVHWADDATLEFLLFLVSRQPPLLSLVVTYRPEDVPPGSLLLRLSSRHAAGTARLRLAVGALDVTHTGRLMSSMLDDEPVSPAFAALLHQHTDGIPLAVEESVRLLHDRADLTRRDGEWMRRRLNEIDVPPTVRDAVLERVERLSAPARAVLRAASALSDPVDEAMLGSVLGMAAPPAGGLAEALASGLLRESGGLVSFRHALASRTVYEAIPPSQRRTMHRRAGHALAARTPLPVSRLARHFREAGDVGEWMRYAEQAADLALAAADEAGASALLYDLVTHTELPAAATARLTRKIPFSSFTGDDRFRGLVRALRSAVDTAALSPAEEAETRYQLGRVLTLMEEFEAGRVELEKAVPHLPPGSFSAAQAMVMLGWPHESSAPASEHLCWLRRAGEQSESLPPVERLGLLTERISALLLLGEESGWAEAALLPGAASTASESRHLGKAHLNLGDAAVYWGRFEEAHRHLATASEIVERHRFTRYRDTISATRIHLDWFTGDWPGLAARATALADDNVMQPVTQLEAVLVGALLGAASGDPAAGERFRHVLAETHRRGAPELVSEPAAALARVLLEQGHADEALRITEGPIRLVAGKEVWLWATDLAPARVQALVVAGRLDEAVELTGAFAGWVRGRDAAAPRAGLELCRALLAESRGDPGRAAVAFARAAGAWRGLPRPYDALLAQERQVACLLAAGAAEEALQLARRVFQELTELGARTAADRMARLLREHRVEMRGRGRRGYGDQLSPRELEVVRLLATGRTNREIATVLSRSPKTVAAQVNSAMRKLGVSSRTALAVSAVESSLLS
ncbi:helix-turn-helix transcriptional regulator [Streptosporangium sp. CA-135522]|uniref:helix-turn-helix transcriptional regulator n=1 Tax=Streptosporangium sp. CA-135522 TaxID=3240072 RepID=UPI003D8A90A7